MTILDTVWTAALDNEIAEETSKWRALLPTEETLINIVSGLLQTIIQVAVIFVVFVLVKHTAKKFMKRYFTERKFQTLFSVLSGFLKYFLYFIGISLLLYNVFGISIASIMAVAGVGGIALGFGAQSLVRDIITGLFILIEDQYSIGDIIEVCGKSGTVEKIDLRITKIRDANGDMHVIPNGEITIVTNMCKEYNRAIVEVSVSYNENTDRVIGILEDEMTQYRVPEHTNSMPEVQGILRFDENAMVLRVTCDCFPGENWAMERELRKRIKARFDKEGIKIPYHQMVVHQAEKMQ